MHQDRVYLSRNYIRVCIPLEYTSTRDLLPEGTDLHKFLLHYISQFGFDRQFINNGSAAPGSAGKRLAYVMAKHLMYQDFHDAKVTAEHHKNYKDFRTYGIGINTHWVPHLTYLPFKDPGNPYYDRYDVIREIAVPVPIEGAFWRVYDELLA